MSNIVNLNRFRKRKAQAEKEKCAEENRIKFGRKKSETMIEKAEAEKQKVFLDGHRKDDEDC